MVAVLFIGAVLVAAEPSPLPAEIAPVDRVAYEEAKARSGRDPDANVRLALWCEANGLKSERLEHLVRAVLSDPSNAAARGLLGMVAYHGQWKQPEDVAANARSDDSFQATLAAYEARREALPEPETADAHWKLGVWCEQNGLKAEAVAHFSSVTRLDPERGDAWARLGCRKFGGRWLSEAQIAADQAEARAQREADAQWVPRLKQWWKDWLADKDDRTRMEETLAETLEPRAVPSIRALFAKGTTEQQLVAVPMLARIDAPEATRELARFATMARSEPVRQRATEALTRRDPNEVIDPLVGLMRLEMGVSISSARGSNPVSALQVEDEEAILQKYYVQNTVRVAPAPAGRMNYGFLGPVLAPKNRRTAQQQMSKDLRTIAARNDARREINESARTVLSEITGQDLGPEPGSWRQWLSDQRGYAYVRPAPTPKRVITRVSQHTQYQFASSGFHSNCFAKGTPVRTLLGLKPIETLRVGDQVLAQDPGSGALSYQPIVVVYHNPPSPTLKTTLGREEIVSTPIHRFWRVGKGWTLARDLKPGDTLRVLGGPATVTAVESDVVQPVFNLEVAEGHSFFVGQQGALVHDNSRIQPPSQPFDAAPPLSAMAQRPTDADGKNPGARR